MSKYLPDEERYCPKCGKRTPHYVLLVTSWDEAHEDLRFQCFDCQNVQWIDGIDS